MRHVTYYDRSTGLLHPWSHLVSDDSAVALNTPSGHEAIDHPHDAMLDRLSQCVDIATGKVVDYQPPSPSADHEWNAATRRWVLSATAKDTQQQKFNAAVRLQELREERHDLIARLTADPQDRVAREAFDAMETEISALRQKI